MGQLIDLAARRGIDRARPPRVDHPRSALPPAGPAFFFDLACPFSYLAAERIERTLGTVQWVPVPAAALPDGAALLVPAALDRARLAAELRAAELRLPLIWPANYPASVPWALRAAAYAAEIGAGASFALAAARMAFCGGYNLEDPRVLAEVAAASGLGIDECRAAAVDAGRDQGLYATANGLLMHGVRGLPAIWMAGRFRRAEAVFGERSLASMA
jgi:2-hydroxychromene-2-carboxylate isomerase